MDIKQADKSIRYAYKTYFYLKTSYLLENTLLEVPDDDNLNESTLQNVSLNQSLNIDNDDKSKKFDVIQKYLESTSIESPEIPENDLGISTIKGNQQTQPVSNTQCASSSKDTSEKIDNESFELSENKSILTFEQSICDKTSGEAETKNSSIECVDDIMNVSHVSKDKENCNDTINIELKVNERNVDSISQLGSKSFEELKGDHQMTVKPTEAQFENENILKDKINNSADDVESINKTKTMISDTIEFLNDSQTDINKPATDNDKVWGSHLNKSASQTAADAMVEKSNSKSKKALERSVSFNFVNKLFDGSKFKKRNPRKSLNKSLSTSSFNLDSTSQSNETQAENNQSQLENNINEKCEVSDLNKAAETTDITEEKPDIKITTQKSSILMSSKVENSLLCKLENNTICTKLNTKWIERCDNQINKETQKLSKNLSVDSGIETSITQCTESQASEVTSQDMDVTDTEKIKTMEADPSPENILKNTNVETKPSPDNSGLMNISNENLVSMFNR